jgi:hypothetical protein
MPTSLAFIALSTGQLVLMILCFAGMVGFAAIAVLLWVRQQQPPPAPRPADKPAPKPAVIEPAAIEPVIEPEPTEFIPLAGQREADSPQLYAPEPERTEFIPSPIAAPSENTEFVTPFGLEVQPSAPEPEERTEFIPHSDASLPAHVEPPPPPPPPAPIPAPQGGGPVLSEHFELAVAALAGLEQAEDAAMAMTLHGHLEVLASAPAEQSLGLLRPVVAAPDSASVRRAAAWLALFQHKSWPTRRALPELLAELDERCRSEGLRALASWDDPRGQSLAAAGLEHATPEHRAEWLELFADRGWDPGDAAVDQALGARDPRLLVVGLRLASTHARAKVSAQLFASDPAVRIEAIETALAFGEQSAWLVCRQLARNPMFPRAAELVGLLGSETEAAQLGQAASIAGSAPLLWGIGLSGRPLALEACASALDDGELRNAAQAALALASGLAFDSPETAREWLAKQTAPRLIGGAPRTLAALASVLQASDSLALRGAIARELRIRARGRVALTPELRPRAFRRQLDELRQLDLDLGRDFPWH